MTPKKEGLKLALDLNTAAQIIADSGHMLPMEAPKESLNLMKKFIQSLET